MESFRTHGPTPGKASENPNLNPAPRRPPPSLCNWNREKTTALAQEPYMVGNGSLLLCLSTLEHLSTVTIPPSLQTSNRLSLSNSTMSNVSRGLEPRSPMALCVLYYLRKFTLPHSTWCDNEADLLLAGLACTLTLTSNICSSRVLFFLKSALRSVVQHLP